MLQSLAVKAGTDTCGMYLFPETILQKSCHHRKNRQPCRKHNPHRVAFVVFRRFATTSTFTKKGHVKKPSVCSYSITVFQRKFLALRKLTTA